MRLTEHFLLSEFLPPHYDSQQTPGEVVAALMDLCEELLEPLRAGVGVPIKITSGYRPTAYNASVGGVPLSDHITGHAADIQALVSRRVDAVKTKQAFVWLANHGGTVLGQLILHDYRKAYGDSSQLSIHVATVSLNT